MLDNILYHYTTIDGFVGIYNSKSIWMTDSQFLNDSQELKKAKKIFLGKLPNDQKKALEEIFSFFSLRHVVFSLSESPKILSQWKGYADDGRGVALGFNSNMFDTYLDKNGILVKCEYENHKQCIDNIIKNRSDIIYNITKNYRSFETSCDIDKFREFIKGNINDIEVIAADLLKIKNNAFREEKEYRYVKTITYDNIKLRSRRDVIVPYFIKNFSISKEKFYIDESLDFGGLVQCIYLGPKCNGLNKIAVFEFGSTLWALDEKNRIKTYNCGYR